MMICRAFLFLSLILFIGFVSGVPVSKETEDHLSILSRRSVDTRLSSRYIVGGPNPLCSLLDALPPPGDNLKGILGCVPVTKNENEPPDQK
ncbi:uncharacterized protein BX664DRAFT_320312 [Halteromyces radiatus]|uniref:uncharacterized protein n=1 Tax=Halteromyces radiatus TaxID=101107 RepID=UPI0022206E2D|nr:uncharacterized protein BX664DRAFT_320312 [Halteromyces radiatus]KAI8099067.1 hypothetical protein BX664DRAFT_320312 [Halteromyces radiatus]